MTPSRDELAANKETFTFTRGECLVIALSFYGLGLLIGLFVWGPQVWR